MRLSPFSKGSYVGIDLGHHTIKAVHVEPSGSGWRVSRQGKIPTPHESIKDGVVVDQQAVAEAIKALLKESHVGATSAHIAVSGATVVVRTVRIPKMPEATLRKSIKYEASRYVPNSTEDSYIEFEIVGPAAENQMDVLIVAAPKDVVESRVHACEAAGLEVESVDIASFAAYRALVEADQLQNWGDTTIALVDIGATTTNISVVEKGVFAMVRSIPHGGQMLTDALVGYFKLSAEDAESGKSQLDLTELLHDKSPKENPPLRVVQPHVDELVREIRRSLNYYQSQQTESAQPNAVGVLLLCGGSASMTGLAAYLAKKLSIETRAISLYDNPRFSAPHGEQAGHGYDVAVASGLAMRAFPKAA